MSSLYLDRGSLYETQGDIDSREIELPYHHSLKHSFLVSVVSQFLQSLCDSHWDVVILILRYIKGTLGQRVLYENIGHTQIVCYRDVDLADAQTDIGHTQTDAPLSNIVYLLEAI